MADKIDTRTKRQKNSKKTRSQPVRGRKIIDPRTREELEKRSKRKSKLGPAGGIKKKDDADKLASFHKAKFFTGPTETAKDKINPMKAQRLFYDSNKFRQKGEVKKSYETGVDTKTGKKMSDTKTANYFRKNSDKDSVKKATEDFFKPFDQKRMFNKGGKVKLALKGGGRAFGKNS